MNPGIHAPIVDLPSEGQMVFNDSSGQAHLPLIDIDSSLNGTATANVTVHDFTESTFAIVITSVVLGVMNMTTIIGNVFVIAAILIERNLRVVANYLILSLAVADLLVAVLVMPLSAVYQISGQWTFGSVLCDMWTSSDVLCCTASILHLLAIAVDRYFAVTQVQYIHSRTTRTIGTMITMIWLTSVVVSLAPLFGWKDPDSEIRVTIDKECLVSQDVGYQIFATMSTFYVPLVAILLLYWRIFMTARNRLRRRMAERAQVKLTAVVQNGNTTSAASNGHRLATAATIDPASNQVQTVVVPTQVLPDEGGNKTDEDALCSDINELSDSHHPVKDILIESSAVNNAEDQQQLTKLKHSMSVDQSLCNGNSGGGGGVAGSHQIHAPHCQLSVRKEYQSQACQTDSSSPTKTPGKTLSLKLGRSKQAKSSVRVNRRRHNQASTKEKKHVSLEAKRERKAAKTLAIVTGAFIACWLPFFILALLMAIFKSYNFNEHVIAFFLWLGYFNSTLNPIIYTIFSPEFRQAFKRLLCGKPTQNHRPRHLQ